MTNWTTWNNWSDEDDTTAPSSFATIVGSGGGDKAEVGDNPADDKTLMSGLDDLSDSLQYEETANQLKYHTLSFGVQLQCKVVVS
jgi:hypothetical protein